MQLWYEVGWGRAGQVDRAERGFSFMRDGPLDMRMAGPSGGGNGASGAFKSAEDLVNGADEGELGRILRDYGEERAWRSVAARCPSPAPSKCCVPTMRAPPRSGDD